MKKSVISIVALIFCSFSCNKPELLTSEVLVIGGGASGVSAAIQAARSGAQVLVVEETPWLGGMLTSAGVSATDGNHRLPSGLWGEFRQKLYDHYGGPDFVSTGWVSFTLFEPHVGNQKWNELADEEPNLTRLHGYRLEQVMTTGKKVEGAVFTGPGGKRLEVSAEVTIDATELGDALARAGAAFHTGFDTPTRPIDSHIQDLTYAAILKDFGPEADKTISQPPNYTPEDFHCICKTVCDDDSMEVMDCEQVLNYALLPGDKYMLNWPHNGNDYYVNPIPLSYKEREEAYQAAKNKTLGLVYFLQTEAGYSNLGLAEDEFPTEDKLPFIPYHRESRRVKGPIRLEVEDILAPYADTLRPLYREAIAVGDYPLDHHHKENPQVPEEEFPPIPSFSIPYRVMVPEEMEGLLVAEKSISVSHLVNGATRLQPVVIELGQVAGAAAALCIKQKLQPNQVPIRQLQQTLLDAGCWLMPYLDIAPDMDYFQSIQRVGTAGWMRGKGIPYQWANQTWFYPDSCVTEATFDQALYKAKIYPQIGPNLPSVRSNNCISWSSAMLKLWQSTQQNWELEDIFQEIKTHTQLTQAILSFQEQNLIEKKDNYDLDRPLTRKELAVWLDKIFKPYGEASVNADLP